jgi:hypothetical protein
MAKNKSKRLPPFGSLDELVEFFDTHDMGEYWDHLPEAHFDIHIKRRAHLVAIDEELIGKLTEIARAKHVSAETLINSWLKEKVLESGEISSATEQGGRQRRKAKYEPIFFL